MHHPDPRYAARLATYGTVATRLSLLSDRRLGEVVAAAIIDRHSRVAVIFGEFAHRLLTESKRTSFPTAEVRRAWRTTAVAAPH